MPVPGPVARRRKASSTESMISAMELDGLMGEMTGEPDAGELADLVFAGTLFGCW